MCREGEEKDGVELAIEALCFKYWHVFRLICMNINK